MTSSPALMERFMDALLTGNGENAGDYLKNKDGFPPEKQLSVYTEAYRLRLLEVLRGTFPALVSYLGEARFNIVAERFIREHPSRRFNIDAYPPGFAPYFVAEEPDSAARELAMLEHAVAEVYMAGESAPLTPQWAAAQTEASLAQAALALRTASRLMMFTYQVNDYLDALREGKTPQTPQAQPNYLLIVRHRHQVQRLALSQGEYALLGLLDGRTPLAKALEHRRFAPHIAEASQGGELMRWFTRWIEKGLLQEPCLTTP